MKLKELFKEFYANKNLFIAVCVFFLTLSTIGISYSAFFTIKSNTNNQTVTTGTLDVSYTGDETILGDELLPLPDREGLNAASTKVIYVQNGGTLESNFALTIGYDMAKFSGRSEPKDTDELTPIEFIKFAIYNYNSVNQESTLIAGPLTIADLPIYEVNEDYRQNQYLILFDKVGAKGSATSSKTYQIKVWLGDNTTPIASHTYFFVKSQIIAEVEGVKRDYNLSGILTDSSGTALSGATINIQNGSKVASTDSNGAFTIPNIYEGTYNVDITSGDKIYSGNITIKNGNTLNVTNNGPTFQASSDYNIFNYAHTFGTTVNKILKKNTFVDSSSDIVFTNESYNLATTYLITSNVSDISALKLNLTEDGGFTLTK